MNDTCCLPKIPFTAIYVPTSEFVSPENVAIREQLLAAAAKLEAKARSRGVTGTTNPGTN